ncbi:DNA damage-binding protein 1a [Coemansia aciculifera]|uniref:DNA damage-binding protein 1a n=1 Tax=Coemansia aciculifera TaxID=417176 RepID=A0A9W8ILF1_9FUNG|nr:DNA damage-binding protein 1a [Coemansia aciculifera]
MQYQYIVSAHKASSVTSSVNGPFRTPNETNLLVAKGNRLEIFTTTTCLQLVGEYSFHGQISSLHIFHPEDRLTCLVLVVSGEASRNKFAVLSWDATEQTILTESSGEIIEHTGRPTTESKLVAVDYEARVIVVYAYQGIVHLFPLVGVPSDSGWRSLVKSTGSDRKSGSRMRTEGDDEERYPYTVREQLVGGLRVPPYLRPDDEDEENRTTSQSKSVGKGKGVAHAIRSSDMYPALTRYIRELKVLDLQFVRRGDAPSQRPAFAVLYEDANMARQVHVYSIDEVQGELRPQSLWTSDHVEPTSNMLIPLPRGAVLVVGDEALTVVAANRSPLGMSKRAATVTAFEWIDTQTFERLLLADDSGVLSLVVFQYDRSGHVKEMFVERLGSISVASGLSYLGDGCVYVGSHCGDHAAVRLHTEPLGEEAALCSADDVLAHPLGSAGKSMARPNTFIEPIEPFTNLAPVVDLCMVGMGSNDSSIGKSTSGNYGSIVACSGQRTTPGLRLVRNGVGVESVAELAVSGVVNAWSLSAEVSGLMDVDSIEPTRYVVMVLSLVDSTRVMGWTEPSSGDSVELEELSAGGSWRLDELTLAAGLTSDGRHAVQVTPSGVVLLQPTNSGWQRCAVWEPSDGSAISAASSSGDQVAVAMDGSLVAYLEVHGSALECVAQQRLAHAVSCIDVHSWSEDKRSAYVAVGLWASHDVCLLALPSLAEALTISVGGGLSRSVLMCVLGGTAYVLVGGGDGRLHHFSMTSRESPGVAERKCVRLGSRPLALAGFSNHGEPSVFAASDHSAVLFAHRQADGAGRLMCANVDAQDIRCVAAVQSGLSPHALLLLVSESRLSLARADPAQRLHVRPRPLPPWAAPHRLAFSAALAVYGVATIHTLGSVSLDMAEWMAGMSEPLVSRALPAEAARFTVLGGDGGGTQPADILDSLLLQPYEIPESLCVATLTSLLRPPQTDGGESQRPALEDVFVLGTSVVLPGEDDAKRGRVLVLLWDTRSRRIAIAGSFVALGAVYAVASFRGMILAAIGSRLLLLGWQQKASNADEYELVALCSQQTQIAALSLAVNGDYVIVGDVMASASVYHYEENTSDAGMVRRRLVPVARDYAGVWTTSVAAVPPPLLQNAERLYPSAIDEETGFASSGPGGGLIVVPQHAQVFGDSSSERFIVSDAYHNIFRVALSRTVEQKMCVEARWHLSDQINVMRPGSLVMDVPDPEFPDVFRATLVFGTVQGAIGIIASVEDGRIGRILDRLQINMAHLLPTPGLWDYDEWRAYASDQRTSRAFGVLDGDLIERFLDLSPEMQRLVFEGGGVLLDAVRREAAERRKKAEYWTGHARVEAEGEVVVLGQMAVSDISAREHVTLDYVVRLVECLTRLH